MAGPSELNHQVFISFRGEDIRDGFLSHLKDDMLEKGVNVKIDEDALRGKPINENLLKLIRDSKVAVVIFTEKFLESDSCLYELVEIEKQRKLKKLDPFPVFFAVEPSHVRLEEESSFKDNLLRLEDKKRRKARNKSPEALENAEKRFLSWREALVSIAGCMGLTHKTGNQAIFRRGVVEKVKEMLAKVPSPNGMLQHRVFISFRGRDIRSGFASHLLHDLKMSEINVFVDDVENLTGRENIDNLFIGIQESRIALVIFTENYMSSAWCLEELVEINKCMNMNSLKVLPIFYNVEPQVDGKFYYRLVEIWGATDARINRWNQALLSVGTMPRYVSTPQIPEADLVKDIINATMNMLADISSN